MELQKKIVRMTDILRRDGGVSGIIQYTEQISWILLLKFLDFINSKKERESLLVGEKYLSIIEEKYLWSNWACRDDGDLVIEELSDENELIDYINHDLFPYLRDLSTNRIQDSESFNYKISSIFLHIDNKITSGHTLRKMLDIIDSINLESSKEILELAQVYEELLQSMGGAGGYAGEIYTPRPLVRTIVKALGPEIGETIYDGAAGSCGFLVGAYNYLTLERNKISPLQWEKIQTGTFFGCEKTAVAYVMGMVNLLIHGVESPNLLLGNTLQENVHNIEKEDCYDIIIANPPFGGKENKEIQKNFPIQSSETELLFLQHFMSKLKDNGKAAIIVPEGMLSNTSSSYRDIKQALIDDFNLHTILSLPVGTFLPYSGVKTNVLFFDRRGSTSNVWYYECEIDKKLSKNNIISDQHLNDFLEKFSQRLISKKSWFVSVSNLIKDFDFSARNPNKIKKVELEAPFKIIEQVTKKNNQIFELVNTIKGLDSAIGKSSYETVPLSRVVEINNGIAVPKIINDGNSKEGVAFYKIPQMNNHPEYMCKPEITFEAGLASDHKIKIFPKGSVLIPRRGPGVLDNVKRRLIEDASFDNNIMCLKADNHFISDEFLFDFMRTINLSDFLDVTTSAVPTLNKKSIENIEIPVPSLKKQKDIVDRIKITLSKIDSIELEIKLLLDGLHDLRASILNTAFKAKT